MRTALMLLVVVMLAACTGTTGAADVVVGDVPPSMPAAGGGVCCTPNLGTGCSPGFGLPGGWAPSAAACPRNGGGFDGCPFVARTDEHGCREIVSGGCAPEQYCGRAVLPDVVMPPADATDPDAGLDAATSDQ